MLGRFDGGAFSWGFTPSWRVGLLAGRPAYETLGERPNFAGVTLDGTTGIEGLGLGVYAILQRAERLTDRKAVGAELRGGIDGRLVPEATVEQDAPLVRHRPRDHRDGDARLDRVDKQLGRTLAHPFELDEAFDIECVDVTRVGE